MTRGRSRWGILVLRRSVEPNVPALINVARPHGADFTGAGAASPLKANHVAGDWGEEWERSVYRIVGNRLDGF